MNIFHTIYKRSIFSITALKRLPVGPSLASFSAASPYKSQNIYQSLIAAGINESDEKMKMFFGIGFVSVKLQRNYVPKIC